MPLSSLQKKILVQYRSFLKLSWNNPVLKQHIKDEFQKYGKNIPKSDFLHIEHLLRRGDKQLKMLKEDGVDGIKYFGRNNTGNKTVD